MCLLILLPFISWAILGCLSFFGVPVTVDFVHVLVGAALLFLLIIVSRFVAT